MEDYMKKTVFNSKLILLASIFTLLNSSSVIFCMKKKKAISSKNIIDNNIDWDKLINSDEIPYDIIREFMKVDAKLAKNRPWINDDHNDPMIFETGKAITAKFYNHKKSINKNNNK